MSSQPRSPRLKRETTMAKNDGLDPERRKLRKLLAPPKPATEPLSAENHSAKNHSVKNPARLEDSKDTGV